jgi:predicted ArsR family transcriptional regulator
MSHPLRIRILRLCSQQELTNKQLAARLQRDPGTVLYHVRQLVDAGFLEQVAVRNGVRGALEKPYRSTEQSWWLDSAPTPTADQPPAIEAFQEELREAGPGSISTLTRFMLHLSPEAAVELERRMVEILDEYVKSDDERLDLPAHGGIIVVHRLAQ